MQISLKKVLIAFLVVLVLSRTGRILQLLEGLDCGSVLTLEPLRRSPEEGRFIVTVLFYALLFVTVFFLFKRK